MIIRAIIAKALDGDPTVNIPHTEAYIEVFYDLDIIEPSERPAFLAELKAKAIDLARFLAADDLVPCVTDIVYEGEGSDE